MICADREIDDNQLKVRQNKEGMRMLTILGDMAE
jgi:uncharacterized protein YeeX (DUF496 family)